MNASPHFTRRSFLQACGAAGLGALAYGCAGKFPRSSGARTARPNILFIYTDDQRYDALGIIQRELGASGRFPWLKTPNLDRLAGEGLRFRDAFVVNSLCSPSRATILTGTYSHINGVKDNFTPLPEHNVTVGELMRQAGYTTGYFGKWHMDKQKTRPGFDTWASQIGHGWYQDCHLDVNGEKVETKGWLDDVVTDYTLDFLRGEHEKPFFAVVGYKAPHSPYDRGEGQTTAYDDVEAQPVPNLGMLPGFMQDIGPERKPLDATELTRNHFRMLDNIDMNVGRILDTLDAEGLTENTVVIYTSDNGYFLGEHGVGDKRLAYDESLRIPLLVRWPGEVAAGTTTDAMALNIDFAPTFLDLAGAPIPGYMQGTSLVPVFENTDEELRDCYFYEYYPEERAKYHPLNFAIRTRTAKLIHYPQNPAWNELYDLEQDPYETNNVIDDPAYADTRKRLEKLLRSEAERLKLPAGELEAERS